MLFSKVFFFLRFSIEYKPKGCFVSGCFVSTDVLSPRTFCLPDVLSLRTFCLYGSFVSTDVLSLGRYVSSCFVSGRFVSGRFVPTDVLSPDVLSGHRRDIYCIVDLIILLNLWFSGTFSFLSIKTVYILTKTLLRCMCVPVFWVILTCITRKYL